MTTKLLFLVLPALALAKIDVELSGDFNSENSNLNVYYSGNEIGVITDNERVTFHLDDNTLKNSVNAYFGKRPDDAYLRSPTPWGDLYKTYGWSQNMATAASDIVIDITLSNKSNECLLTHTGEDRGIIDVDEEITFQVDDAKLKQAVEKYFGKKPNEVYLHSPTPWGDIFKKNNWQPVTRVLSIGRYEIVSHTYNDTELTSKEFANKGSAALGFNCSFDVGVVDEADVSWHINEKLHVDNPLNFGVHFRKEKERLNFKAPFGKVTSSGKELRIASGLTEITVKPKTKLLAKFLMKKVEMAIAIQFVASLTGKAAVVYDPKYKNESLYAFDIDEVMKAAGIKDEVINYATVSMGFYDESTARIETEVISGNYT